MLTAALEGEDTLHVYVGELLHTLRVVMFLTGAATVADLRTRDRIITGSTAEWLRATGRA